MTPLLKRTTTATAALLALAGALISLPAHAGWTAADDEANRQRMMNDMRRNDYNNDQRNNTPSVGGYSSSTSSGSSYSGSSSSSSSYTPYVPYEYKPEGPHSVVATYTFTVYQQETEAQTIARIKTEAEGGNAQSQYNMGRIYYTGYGVPLDESKARYWFCEAARQDHPIAKSQCAAMMYNGQGGAQDKATAMAYLKDAAAKGDPYGEALYGFFTIGATTDIDSPQPEAVAYLVKAADQGQAIAQATLGSMVYFYGAYGATQDVPRAVGYLRQCAAQKTALCMSMMGEMLISGQNGVDKDMTEGVKMLTGAAEGGDAEAAGVLALLYGGDGFGMRDDATAFKYARQSAAGGNVRGEVLLAKLYYFGQGVTKDIVESARWFTAAAAQGDQESIDALKEPDIAEAAKQL